MFIIYTLRNDTLLRNVTQISNIISLAYITISEVGFAQPLFLFLHDDRHLL